MSKKQKQPFNSLREAKAFVDLESHWYAVLRADGFQDQENVKCGDRPLKYWSGISSIYVEPHQPPAKNIISSFPESIYWEEERFQNHPDFEEICKTLCQHGNSRLQPWKVKMIWADHCAGKTQRQIESFYQVSDTTVFRLVQSIKEWMKLMDQEQEEDNPGDTVTVVLRTFRADADNPMIFSTWRNSLWYAEKRDERLANEFYSRATQAIKALLRNPYTVIRVACSEDDPNHIIGYSVLTHDHLEFVYVKIDYRRRGIAKLLTKGIRTIATPMTRIGHKVAARMGLEVKENHEVHH